MSPEATPVSSLEALQGPSYMRRVPACLDSWWCLRQNTRSDRSAPRLDDVDSQTRIAHRRTTLREHGGSFGAYRREHYLFRA